MKFCTNCGAQLQDAAKFCTSCGQKQNLVQQTAPVSAVPPVAPVYAYEDPNATMYQPVQPEEPAYAYADPNATMYQPVQPEEPAYAYADPNATMYQPVQPEEPAYAYAQPQQPVYAQPQQPPYVPRQQDEFPTWQDVQASPFVQADAPAQQPQRPQQPQKPQQPSYTDAAHGGSVPAAQASPQKPAAPANKKKSPLPWIIIGIVVLLAAAAAAVFFLLGGKDANDPNLGRYEAVSCYDSGNKVDVDDEWIELKSDGNAEMNLMGEEYDGKWSLKNDEFILRHAGEEYVGTLEDGILEITVSGMEYVFAKDGAELPDDLKDEKEEEKPKEEPKEEPVEAPAATVAPEVGYWTLLRMDSTDPSNVVSEDMVTTMREVGVEVYMILNEDGTGIIYVEEESELTWEDGTITLVGDDEVQNYTIENDQLSLTDGETTAIFVRGEGDAPAQKPDAPAVPAEPAEEFSPVSGVVEGCPVSIVGAERFTSYDGEAGIRFYYDYTNNTDESSYADWDLWFHAEQNGTELEETSDWSDTQAPEYGNDYKYVQPGITIRCVAEYVLLSETDAVTFSITDYSEEEVVKCVFDLNNLPGRPTDEIVFERIWEPTYVADLSDEGVYDDEYYVFIADAEYAEGAYGENAVRVYFEFTNNSAEEESFFMISYITAYQNGVELETVNALVETTEDENYWVDIQPGQTILCSVCFELIDDETPIEIELYNFSNEDPNLGCIFYQN